MNINLLPWREALNQKRKKRLYIEGALIFTLVIFFLVIWKAWEYHILTMQEKQIVMLEKKIIEISPNYRDALNKKNIKNLYEKQEIFFDVLDQIILEIPEEIYLKSIKKKERTLYLVGQSPSHAELNRFLKRIEEKIHKKPIVIENGILKDKTEGIYFEIGYEI